MLQKCRIVFHWRLIKEEIDDELIKEGIIIPAGMQDSNKQSNLAFLRAISSKCYNPVFIFTNEDIEEIKEIINSEFNLTDHKQNNFFVLSKTDIEKNGQFLESIEKWIMDNPSIYLLKEWEMQYKRGKYDLFTQFYKYSAYWPNILWDNFKADGANESMEMNELVIRNLMSRIAPYEFEEKIFEKTNKEISADELCNVLEGDRFISAELLHQDDIATGDLFRKDEDGELIYYLNIRAQCDIARDSNPKLYLIKGKILERNADSGKYLEFDSANGTFNEKINDCIIPFIDNGKVIKFKLRDLHIMKFNELKNYKIGKILPPYITRIQQKYAAYHQRQGLPRIPCQAIENSN